MTAFVLSLRAREDLSHIWDDTAHHWGKDQADLYVRKIAAVCGDLAAGRRQGRSAKAIRAGYLKCAAGSHVLFYRFSDTGEIHVIRILHQRMDVDQHLETPGKPDAVAA